MKSLSMYDTTVSYTVTIMYMSQKGGGTASRMIVSSKMVFVHSNFCCL